MRRNFRHAEAAFEHLHRHFLFDSGDVGAEVEGAEDIGAGGAEAVLIVREANAEAGVDELGDLYAKFWRENRFYTPPSRHSSTPSSRLMNGLLALGSAIAYYESRLLARVPLFATALHLTAVKPFTPPPDAKRRSP